MNDNFNSVHFESMDFIMDFPTPTSKQETCFRFDESGFESKWNCIPVKLDEPSIFKKGISKVKLPAGTKSFLDIEEGENPYLWASYSWHGGMVTTPVMSDIKDVNVLIDNKVIIVTFADGTSEKAVLTGSDVYSFEQGISICITKKLLSNKSNGNGSSLYNKIIDRAVKKYNKAQKDKKKAEEQKKAAEAKYQKTVAKKAAKRAKREAAAREEKINIQKEAIIRAMKELNSSPADVSV